MNSFPDEKITIGLLARTILLHTKKQLSTILYLLHHNTQHTTHNNPPTAKMTNNLTAAAASSSASPAVAIDEKNSTDEKEVSADLADHSGDEDNKSTSDEDDDVNLESIFRRDGVSGFGGCIHRIRIRPSRGRRMTGTNTTSALSLSCKARGWRGGGAGCVASLSPPSGDGQRMEEEHYRPTILWEEVDDDDDGNNDEEEDGGECEEEEA